MCLSLSLFSQNPIFSGIMGVRVGILFLLVLGARWTCADARRLVISDLLDTDLVISEVSGVPLSLECALLYMFKEVNLHLIFLNRSRFARVEQRVKLMIIRFAGLVIQINYQVPKKEIQTSEAVVGNKNICTYCKEFTAQALYYLGENMTQTAIIAILEMTCSQLHPIERQCIKLVDYYAALFFSEIGMIQPEDFCTKVDLCSQVEIDSLPHYQDSCGFCHHAVAEVLVKLKDPDMQQSSQLEIIELLLKGCNAVENYVKQCKKLVFEYVPLIMSNAEQFLETTSLCTTAHACIMDVRAGILFFLVLGARWACADVKRLVISDLLGTDLVISKVSGVPLILECALLYLFGEVNLHIIFLNRSEFARVEKRVKLMIIRFTILDIQINYQVPKKEIQTSEAVVGNKNIFTYCKEFTAQALYYLGANMTQTAIITILEITCSQLHPFKRQYPDSCGFCHRAIAEVLVKLKDPDMQLEIIELLLKGCNAVENYAKQLVFEYVPLIMSNAEQLLLPCKKLVFEYVPLIMSNAEQLLLPCKKLMFEYVPMIISNAEQLLLQCKKLMFEYVPLIMSNAEQLLLQCKKLVFEYVPLIMSNAEQFLLQFKKLVFEYVPLIMSNAEQFLLQFKKLVFEYVPLIMSNAEQFLLQCKKLVLEYVPLIKSNADCSCSVRSFDHVQAEQLLLQCKKLVFEYVPLIMSNAVQLLLQCKKLVFEYVPLIMSNAEQLLPQCKKLVFKYVPLIMSNLEIIELLLMGFNAVENYSKQCKKLVFEYVPLIMSNVEQLLETTSLCTTFHACEASNAAGSEQASSPVKISTLSES
ncbi:hypothetical protein HHK36_018652 [Tetracentron sinense]|uniref:Saposin B-type domain-containing protein n=1 Tax=Tetracentron sinense TaxID=13715 RepID=A0A834YWB6_TETSI|nr:hypothetical protein HHK36_018652 [Tetracentron sinense]